jgi:chromosome segregation ATPase
MKIKFLLASVLVIALIFQSGTMNAQQKNEKQKNDSGTSLNVMSDRSSGSGESLINFTEDGHRYKIRLSGSKVIEMFVDDKKVAEEDYAKYDSMVKKILLQIEKDRKQAEEDRKQAEKDRERADQDRKQADKDREQAEKNRQQADKDRERAEQDREQADKDREQAEKNRQQADKDRERAEQDREQAGKDREQAEKDRQQAEIDRKQAEEDRKLLNEMIDEVIKEKLVENKEALKSLVLDDNEFIINGIKQPGNLHSKFKTKYLKNSRRKINYRNSDGFRGMSVD